MYKKVNWPLTKCQHPLSIEMLFVSLAIEDRMSIQQKCENRMDRSLLAIEAFLPKVDNGDFFDKNYIL